MPDTRERRTLVAGNLILGASITFTLLGSIRFARTVANGQPRVAFYAIWGFAGMIWALHTLRDRLVVERVVGVGVAIGIAAQLVVVLANGGSPTAFTYVTVVLLGALSVGLFRSEQPFRPIARFVEMFSRTPETPAWTPTRGTLVAAGIAGLSIVFIGTAMLVSNIPLGHDESVYALKARAWIEATPASGFGIHRPVGMAVIAASILKLSNSVLALRLGGAVASLLALVAMFRLGVATRRKAASIITIVAFAAGQPYLRRAPEFLNDMATSGLLIGVLVVVWRVSEGHDRTFPLWVASVLSAAAFYLRYGSAVVVVIIVAVAGLMFRSQVREQARSVAIAAMVLATLIVPHLVYSLSATGSLLGVLKFSSEAAGRDYLGDGLVRYIAWFPAKLTGAALAVVMLVGVVHTFHRRRFNDTHDRLDRFIVSVSLLSGIAVGITVHGELRYVFLNVLLLSFVGWSSLLRHAHSWSDDMRRFSSVALAAVLLVSLGTGVFEARIRADKIADDRAVLTMVAGVVESGDSCVIIASYVPQLTWMSRCVTITFDSAVQDAFVPRLSGPSYLVTFENGKRQPEGEYLATLLQRFTVVSVEPIQSLTDRIGDATVYRIEEQK